MPYDTRHVNTSWTELRPAASRQAATLLRHLAVLWRRPNVARLRVVVHPRLRRTLGRYSRSANRIELSPTVLSPKALTDVLTHEAAHAAIAQGKTTTGRAHGPEWRRLMAQAGKRNARATRWCAGQPGDSPQTRAKAKRGTGSTTKATKTYDHWCPVCQASRLAKRPVRGWRCAPCVAAGLPGRLEITLRAPSAQR